MSREITIGGVRVALEWSQRTSRVYIARASKLGLDPLTIMGKPARRVYGIAAFFWLLLPQAEHSKHETPEDLFAAMSDDEFNSPETVETLLGLFDDISPSDEKKSSSKKSPSPGSNSGLKRQNGRR